MQMASRGLAVCLVARAILLACDPPAASALVERVGGDELGVEERDGSATLRLPIDVPPGPGGLEPRLSFDYSSARGNGPLGVGWGLTLGEIRCATRRGVPTQPGCDEYELNGQLLVGPDASGSFHTFVAPFNIFFRR